MNEKITELIRMLGSLYDKTNKSLVTHSYIISIRNSLVGMYGTKKRVDQYSLFHYLDILKEVFQHERKRLSEDTINELQNFIDQYEAFLIARELSEEN